MCKGGLGEDRNLRTYALIQPNEESVLVLMLVREDVLFERCKAALLVFQSGQVTLWASLLTRMTDLNVAGLDECSELDTGQIVKTAGIQVTTHITFTKVLNRKQLAVD